jgi:hypothetical protein
MTAKLVAGAFVPNPIATAIHRQLAKSGVPLRYIKKAFAYRAKQAL